VGASVLNFYLIMPRIVPNGIDSRPPLETQLPQSSTSAASVGLNHADRPISSLVSLGGGNTSSNVQPATTASHGQEYQKVYLELQDGQIYEGISFGAPHSAAGELVFQTGMVGYPESITDPSYRGQILIITFPLVGNYGVPSRSVVDELLGGLPKYFESNEIHVAGLVVASYSGEQFSHYLAQSSLGTWLKEQGVPAMYGVDTRALTKLIREHGSILGRMLHQQSQKSNVLVNGSTSRPTSIPFDSDWRTNVSSIEWDNQNERNLVEEGGPKKQSLSIWEN
jgi:carbamoyl-phosphate synthase / aspartate carbamoyltransferase